MPKNPDAPSEGVTIFLGPPLVSGKKMWPSLKIPGPPRTLPNTLSTRWMYHEQLNQWTITWIKLINKKYNQSLIFYYLTSAMLVFSHSEALEGVKRRSEGNGDVGRRCEAHADVWWRSEVYYDVWWRSKSLDYVQRRSEAQEDIGRHSETHDDVWWHVVRRPGHQIRKLIRGTHEPCSDDVRCWTWISRYSFIWKKIVCTCTVWVWSMLYVV